MEPRKRKVDQAIEDFLEGESRAKELRDMANILAARLSEKRKEFKESAPGSVEWDLLKTEIQALEQQVVTLRREEAITQFVEDSVRMTVGVNEMLEGGEEFEERDFSEDQSWKPSGLANLDEEEE